MLDKNKKWEYIIFTAFFSCFGMYSVGKCISEQTIIMEGTDGIAQYYPAMCFIGKWFRKIIESLLQGRLEVPLVEYTLGMGEDILVTLNYYGLGDPFYLLAALVSNDAMPYFYTALFFIRLYLGGMAFILLAKEIVPHKHSSAYVLGAVVYVSSGYTVVANLYYGFIHAVLYIPLMFYGVELILNGRKKRWTIITVFFFALSGFFYLYVGMVACFVYVVIRYFSSRVGIREFLKRCIIWGIAFITGILLAAFVFLPEIVGYLNCTREREVSVPIIYSIGQYKDMFFKLFFAKGANFQVMAFPIVAVIVIVSIMLAEKYTKEKIVVLLCGIAFAIPVFSYIMSGFGGLYDRWQIVLVLCISLLVVKGWEELFEISRLKVLGICNLFLIFLTIGYYEDLLLDDGYYQHTIKIFICIMCCTFVFGYITKRSGKTQIAKWGLCMIGVVSVFLQINNNLRYYDIEYIKEHNVIEEVLNDNSKDEFFRIDNEQVFNQEKPLLNLGFIQGYFGLGEYFSIVNKEYVTALSEWQILSKNSYHSYGINHRTILETLCNVKYMVLQNGHDYLKPYGFDYVDSTQDGIWNVYENKYSLPLGYMYVDNISYESYMKLDGIEKQLAMLEVVALEDYKTENRESVETKWEYIKGGCKILEYDGIFIDEDGNYTAKSGSSMKLLVELKEGYENYFVLEGENTSVTLIFGDSQEFLEGVSMGNLGFISEDGWIELTVIFGNEVSFSKEQLYMGYLPMEKYEQHIQNLGEEQLENVEISANKIKGTTRVNSNRILCMSVPYMPGWKARIDGKEVKVYKANSMFMAIEIPAGEHKIEFIYCTPYLKAGCVISVSTLILCILYLKICKKKKAIPSVNCKNSQP